MIRKFLDLCKHYFKISEINEYDLFINLQKEWNTPSGKCPYCSAPCGSFHKDGSYERDFITYYRGSVHYHKVTISCVECNSCGHSHALLPSFMIPYSSYSAQFLISLIFDYYTKKYKTVALLCQNYGIAITTFYRIYNCFLSDSIFLKSFTTEIAYFNKYQIISYLYTQDMSHFCDLQKHFFHSYGFSFLQRRCNIRPYIPL